MCMYFIFSQAPQMPKLENFKGLTQVKEERELEKMKYSDYNANVIDILFLIDMQLFKILFKESN